MVAVVPLIVGVVPLVVGVVPPPLGVAALHKSHEAKQASGRDNAVAAK